MPRVDDNADVYAAKRQNIFFPGVIPSLDGQCVSLVKWFLGEMTDVPNPQAARGDARYMGKTLVQQGHAVEVPYAQRKRGDVITYEYGTYGHIGVVLSGDRTFEENVNWAGVASKIVDGERVYASRIGNLGESWRHDQHIYRIKSYNESGGDMAGIPDTDSWYWRFNKLTQQIRGRSMSREEFRKYIVPSADPFSGVQTLSDDPEADRNVAFANAGREVFNEGDRQNLNQYMYGTDRGAYKEAIGKPWKEAMYFGIFENTPFKVDQLVNKGDIDNLKTIIGNSKIPDSVVGKSWKDFVYQDLKGLIPEGGNAEQIVEQIRQLVNKEN